MTKKSLGRQRRDELAQRAAEAGADQNWEQLEGVYRDQVALFAKYAEMAQILIHPEVMSHLANTQATANLMKAVASDSTALRAQLEQNYAKHQGRTGTADHEDDWFAITMIHQEYAIMLSTHQQTIMPAMLELAEHLQVALRNREAARLAAEAAAQTAEAVA